MTETTHCKAPTDPEDSVVTGRNGTFHIHELEVWESYFGHVSIEGIGKRGMRIRGGLRVTKECFAEICRQFLNRDEEDLLSALKLAKDSLLRCPWDGKKKTCGCQRCVAERAIAKAEAANRGKKTGGSK